MFSPESYAFASELFLRLMGLVYFFVFFPFLFQIRGLIGEEGILPAGKYLASIKGYLGKNAYYKLPTIFWLGAKDSVLLGSVWIGLFASILLMCKIAVPLMILILYVVHLSLIAVGQDFLSFGWEMFLLEIAFHAFFLSLTSVPSLGIWVSLNFLLFRFHLQAGIVKIQSRDPHWKDLTALAYHYQSQPLPNTQAWFAHKLPLWFHKGSTLAMFIIEIVVPFGIFVDNQWVRLSVFVLLTGLQFAIWFTGNFSYLNYLTAVFCVILVSDPIWSHFLETPNRGEEAPLSLLAISNLAGIGLLSLQFMNVWNNVMIPVPSFTRVLRKVSPFHIGNRYGIFAVMTTKRYEVIVEGSADGKEWKEYAFKYKPSEVDRRPRRIAPYQPRLDWQAWFLPFEDFSSAVWFQNFLVRLLEGARNVTALLRVNPFPGHPPHYIRASFYDYEFTSVQEKRETGAWWKRTYVTNFSSVLSLKNTSLFDEE